MTGEASDEQTAGASRRADVATREPSWRPEGGAATSGGVARWRLVRRVLVVGWLLVAALGLVLGARPSTMSHLEGAVAAGRVDRVEVTPGLGRGGTGYAVVEVRWREHGFRYQTRVIEARPRSQAPPLDSLDQSATAVLTRDVGTVLHDDRADGASDLAVVRRSRPSSDSDLHGWRVPVWLGFAVIGLALATLALLVNGPQPWRGTRWAWFWLMALASPLGVAAFLLLAAPTPLLGAPRADARRLTGGWAFLLGVVLSATLTSLA